MTSEIVREGRAAWCRLRQERAELGDWKALGAALLEGRAIAMHNAGTSHPIGHGYVQALNSWLLDNRLSLSPADRAKLFTVMEILPAIEAWRLTLPEAQRLRLNHPATVLRNYRKSTGIGPAPETSLHRQRRHHHSLRTMVPRDALSLTP